MTQPSQHKKLRQGVYYSEKSYAGFWLRVTSWLVDIIVICVFHGACYYIFDKYSGRTEFELKLFCLFSFLSCYIYLAVMKNTKISTLGFYLTDLKVVNLYGLRPSLWNMSFRFLLLTFGPFEMFPDLLWLTCEKTKQSLRDKYAGTYVVKKSTDPLGEANIIQTRLHVLGWNLVYNEVDLP